MKIFYFTATGNSLAVAKKIKSSLKGAELISIPQILKEDINYEDEVIGLVFPTYCTYMPKIVRTFLKKAKLKAKYKFAIATYGNDFGRGGDGNLMSVFDRYTEDLNIHFNYLNSILMVDNYLDGYDIDKEILKIPSKEIDKNLDKIIDDIKNRKQYVKKGGPIGIILSLVSKPVSKIQDKGLASKDYILNKKCNGCGICTKVCPSRNIKLVENKVEFGNKCYKCYACIHACPNNAIHLKSEKSSKRWRNENVSLSEIIDSNNQNIN